MRPPPRSNAADHTPRHSLARAAILAAPLLLAACQPAVLEPQGSIGTAEKTILIDSLAIMLAIVIPTIAAIFAFAWWYRASNTRATHLPDFEYSGRIELVVWAIPLMVIILLGGVAWIGSHKLDPAQPIASKLPPLEIQGISLDWKWLFIYPDQRVAAVNQLVIPAGRPIHFSLTSASVMNAFFVPQLGSMIYTMNGMDSQLNLMSDQPGTFRGLSSHYSGDGFSDMHFEVHALPPAEFDTWIAATRGHGPSLDRAAYTELSKQSIAAQPMTYGNADPQIFPDLVTQSLAPAAGPPTGVHTASLPPRIGTLTCSAN